MFKFLGRMFGSSKAGEAIIDGAVSGIDKMFYTDEEKADDRAQAKREAMAVYMKWMESTTGSRIARRLLALMAASIWAIQKIIEQVFNVLAVWKEDPAVIEKLTASAEVMNAGASSTADLVAVVFAFYFGGPAAVEISKNALTAFSNRTKNQ